MVIAAGIATTLDIVNIAGSILDRSDPRHARAGQQVDGVKNKVIRAGQVAARMDAAGSSLAQLTAQTTIMSRSFYDESIIDEPIIPNLTRSFHSWYAAQCISALHLSRMVDSGRTVQDVMSIVQTGHNNRQQSVLGNLAQNIASRRMGVESFTANYLGEPASEALVADVVVERDLKKDMSIRSVNSSDNRIGPMGELYEVKLTNPNGDGVAMTVPVFIQMQPSIVPGDIAPRFIDMNVAPSVWQRWTQMRAGELGFWKDFIFNADMHKRFKSTIKNPSHAAAFSDFLRTVAKKDTYAIADVTDKHGARQSSNLANSVVVFSEDTVSQAKIDSGVDLHNKNDRARYFRDSYTMIIAVVDPLHQRVKIYFNGMDGNIDAPYSEFRPKDAKFDPKDFMQALQAFSTGNVGRLR